jgi:pilus assembly protein Flp/PilA
MNAIALRTAVAYQIVVARLRSIPAERGATAVEYALVVGLIAALIVVAVAALGDNVVDLFQETNSNIDAKDNG